jgi:hypothetical protein
MEVADAVFRLLIGVARGKILEFDSERKKLLVTEKLADHHVTEFQLSHHADRVKCDWTCNRYMTGHVILDGKLF